MTLFLKLGATNAWRNIARSALAVLSMSLAAAFLTNAISLSRGYPNLYMWYYRTMLGGEIMVYDNAFIGEIPAGESTWNYYRLGNNHFSDLDIFFPELAERGFLGESGDKVPLDAALCEDLAAVAGVSAVYPRYQIPAETVSWNTTRYTPLRGRDAALDSMLIAAPDSLISEGRWFSAEDDGKLVAVVASHLTKPQGQQGVLLGDKIAVEVPRLLRLNDGSWGLDYENSLLYEFDVIGVLDIATRIIDARVITEEGEYVELNASLYWQLDELQIPLATWQNIWEQASGEAYLPRELALMVEDISYIEDIMLSLKAAHPKLTFIHVPELMDKAEAQLLIEDFSVFPETVLDSLRNMSGNQEQSALPLDLRGPLSLLIFFNAALVIASNLLIMINERKVEIGILKAVGALKREIINMALAEALLIASLGAVGGFLFIRLPALFNQLTNSVPLAMILRSLGLDFVMVIAAALAAALIFGLLPALRMAGLSVSEVLRNE